MSSLTETHQPMKWATKRTARFAAYAAIAFVALFTVLAVKAQVLPKPSWEPPFISWGSVPR